MHHHSLSLSPFCRCAYVFLSLAYFLRLWALPESESQLLSRRRQEQELQIISEDCTTKKKIMRKLTKVNQVLAAYLCTFAIERCCGGKNLATGSFHVEIGFKGRLIKPSVIPRPKVMKRQHFTLDQPESTLITRLWANSVEIIQRGSMQNVRFYLGQEGPEIAVYHSKRQDLIEFVFGDMHSMGNQGYIKELEARPFKRRARLRNINRQILYPSVAPLLEMPRPNTAGRFSQGQPPTRSVKTDHLVSADTSAQCWFPPMHLEKDALCLLKENNIKTLDDLDKLREKYSFPSRVQLRIPEEGETILLARPGKARPDKNLLRRSPSNVKGWKKRFFFASGDEWEFFPSMPPDRAQGYFKVSKVLNSKTFQKYFARGRMETSSSNGDNTTSGDEGVIREDIGRIARRAFPDTPDLTLLRWLEGKVQNPFSNLFPSGLSFSSDLRSESLSNSRLSPELRSDVSLSTLTKKAGEKKVATKDASSAATSQPPLKWVVIQEKHPQEDAHDPATKEGEVEASKGKEAMPPPPPKRTKSNKGASNAAMRLTSRTSSTLPGDNLGPMASMMSSAPMARKILNGVILPADKEKVDQFTTDELVTKSFHALGQVVVLVSALTLRSQDHQNDYHFQLDRADSAEVEMVKAQNRASAARLEAEVAELNIKLAKAKKLAIEEFKSFDDFKEAVTDSVASYFGEGFEFCKRQLLHQHPNLGVDVASMEMDVDLAEEEEAAKAGEKEEYNNGGPTPLLDLNNIFFLARCHPIAYLKYGYIFNGDHGALSRERSCIDIGDILMAIKAPCHVIMNGRILILATSTMATKAPYHAIMNGHILVLATSTMATKAPYHVIMNGCILVLATSTMATKTIGN
ncbi:hypothetical protein Acr_15g0001180 [Actinidia rufa]|uniref:Uncharacterized protein n=1 Tax=Actinidia rufa TaxID=165716 RepID=A0A7J0FS24_9ERIC|nr:hypothetical protein Acr_15g0001180 [Actinidia rufa]